jgi:hypothetical protein
MEYPFAGKKFQPAKWISMTREKLVEMEAAVEAIVGNFTSDAESNNILLLYLEDWEDGLKITSIPVSLEDTYENSDREDEFSDEEVFEAIEEQIDEWSKRSAGLLAERLADLLKARVREIYETVEHSDLHTDTCV